MRRGQSSSFRRPLQIACLLAALCLQVGIWASHVLTRRCISVHIVISAIT